MLINISHLPQATVPLTAPYSQQLAEAFIISCKLLDVVPFASVADESEVFEDLPLQDFLDEIHRLFMERRAALQHPEGYRFLVAQGSSECLGGCSGGKANVVTFKYAMLDGTPVPESHVAYRMVWEDGILLDIFRCLFYKGAGDLFDFFPAVK